MTYLVPAVAGLLGLLVGLVVAAVLAGRPAHRPRVQRPRDVLLPVLSAAACAALAVRFGLAPELPAYLYLALVAVPLAAVDVQQHRLPDLLTLPSYPIGVGLLALAAPFIEGGGRRLLGVLLGMLGLGLCYGLLHLVNRDGMGLGDVKLAGVLGAYLGWLGPDTWVVGAFLGVLFGGLFALALLVLRVADRRSRIPFGPFMLAGALVAVLVSGYELLG